VRKKHSGSGRSAQSDEFLSEFYGLQKNPTRTVRSMHDPDLLALAVCLTASSTIEAELRMQNSRTEQTQNTARASIARTQ
jgi:hypothetical protein